MVIWTIVRATGRDEGVSVIERDHAMNRAALVQLLDYSTSCDAPNDQLAGFSADDQKAPVFRLVQRHEFIAMRIDAALGLKPIVIFVGCDCRRANVCDREQCDGDGGAEEKFPHVALAVQMLCTEESGEMARTFRVLNS